MSSNYPSIQFLRQWEAQRSRRFQRFSDRELREERRGLEKKLVSLKRDLRNGKIQRQSETYGEMRRLEKRSNEIAIELFMRRAQKPSPLGVDWMLSRLESTKGPANPKSGSTSASVGNTRERFARRILARKGWSVHDWANEAKVDFHTANNYLRGKTNPYPASRLKLARALGVDVERLPA